MNVQPLNGINTSENPSLRDDTELMDSCKDFESIFLSMMLERMRATVSKSGLFGSDPGGGIYQSMLDESISEKMASAGGIGLAASLYSQLKDSLLNADTPLNGGVTDAIG